MRNQTFFFFISKKSGLATCGVLAKANQVGTIRGYSKEKRPKNIEDQTKDTVRKSVKKFGKDVDPKIWHTTEKNRGFSVGTLS